jgi:hypothetical protein
MSREQAFERGITEEIGKGRGTTGGGKLGMLAKFDLGTEGAKASETAYQNCQRNNVLWNRPHARGFDR